VLHNGPVLQSTHFFSGCETSHFPQPESNTENIVKSRFEQNYVFHKQNY